MWHDTQHAFAVALNDPALSVPDVMSTDGARLDVYRNNVAVGLCDVLADIFPVVRRLVGADFFAGMAQVYAKKCRPASPVLAEYGQTFGDFIDAFAPARGVPYLADVARLERAWLDAYHAEDQAPLSIAALTEIAGTDLDDLVVILHPSAWLLNFSGPAVSIWQAHQDNQSPDLSGLSDQAELALIVRPHMDVHVHTLSKAGFLFAQQLAEGKSLGVVCDALADTDGFAPSQHLADLFNAGAVIALGRNQPDQGEHRRCV
jgi:hypothetical protein